MIHYGVNVEKNFRHMQITGGSTFRARRRSIAT